MKAHLAKVSLALLSVAFLLGCQEQGSEPVGPEGLGPQFDKPTCGGQHCNHGDEVVDPDPITLTLADGMRAAAFPVEVSKDTRKTLKVTNHDFMKPTIAMDFAVVVVNACKGFVGTNGGTLPSDSEFGVLKAQLTQDAADAKVIMSIDKTNLLGESGRHALIIQYDDKVLQNTYIMLGGWPGPVKVKEGPPDVFTFTGPVVVWDPNNGIKDESVISCPGAKVVVTLDRG